jgi:hypothetical protein
MKFDLHISKEDSDAKFSPNPMTGYLDYTCGQAWIRSISIHSVHILRAKTAWVRKRMRHTDRTASFFCSLNNTQALADSNNSSQCYIRRQKTIKILKNRNYNHNIVPAINKGNITQFTWQACMSWTHTWMSALIVTYISILNGLPWNNVSTTLIQNGAKRIIWAQVRLTNPGHC